MFHVEQKVMVLSNTFYCDEMGSAIIKKEHWSPEGMVYTVQFIGAEETTRVYADNLRGIN